MAEDRPRCVHCERNVDEVPLLTLRYADTEFWICPQHLPVLIHDPARLIGVLPGAEDLRPAEHQD